ncbi:MAG TPA: hypothetical protein VGG72_17800 [Bryobacteraceae bacterium]|jgi:hypothetical protein
MRFSIFVCGLGLAISANASQLFTNGGLETNGGNGSTTFTGWTTGGTAGSDDDFYADDTDITPLNGFPTDGPDSGSWYGVSDMTGLVAPESSYLVQTVTIPVGTIDDLFTADIFVDDQFGASGLGGELAIWASGVNPLTTAPLYVIYSADTTVDGGSPNPYVAVSQDITAQVTAGTTYQIGVFESDSTGPINVGVDNFSLVATPGATTTPEPGMLLPTVLLALGVIVYRARRKVAAQV